MHVHDARVAGVLQLEQVGAIGSVCSRLEGDMLDCPLLILEDTLVLTGIVMGMLVICLGIAGTGWMLTIWGWGNV